MYCECMQLACMSDLWALLHSHHPDDFATYTSLQAVASSLEEGNYIVSLDDITIPAIQPLREVFNFKDPYMGVVPIRQDLIDVMQLSDLALKMEVLHDIVSATSRMTVNAWRKLEGLQYNVNLMEFLMQDFTRVYLQSINNTHCDDPLERRRKCSLLMDVLADRISE